jgi:sarcosine oxidase subunit alpha
VQGHVTSAAGRVLSDGAIALGLLTDGQVRKGDVLLATSPTRNQHARVTVTDPVFYDGEGARYRD